jgi:predicted dehydrogenase
MQDPTSRRDFLKGASLAAAAMTVSTGNKKQSFAQSPNDRIGIGFIGCGGRGGNHLDRVQKMKDEEGANIELVAVCDTYRPRMQARADKYKAKGYMDHHELLADPNVDLVCIATPDHLHGFQALDAVRAKKDVYCEKPVTHWRQFDLTKQLHEEVQKSGQVFQLGSQGMSDEAWIKMKQLVKEGLIGQPIHAECGYFRVGDWGERGMPIDDPNAKPGPDLNWDAFLADSPKRPFDVSRYFRWRMYEDYSGGPATDLFPHSLTPVIYVLGVTLPSSVAATGGKFRYEEREVPDTFNMLIDYPEKITVAVLGTQGNNYNGTGGRGAGGRIPVIRGWEGSLTLEGSEIVFIPAEGSKKEAQRFPAGEELGLGGHWENLLNAVKSRQQPISPMDLAFHVQTTFHMAVLGHRAGKIAKFDPAAGKIIV